MTMDHEMGEGGCQNCSVLRNEIDKRTLQWENSNTQQLAGFLTLKQKIIGTDKLIREYQSSKVECDILTRKNEEFVHLIDQLHRDLNTRNQEHAQICGSIELLKKANADYEMKFEELNDEAQKWKSRAEAGENFTSQLVAKVKVLEKYEEEAKHTASVSRECEKLENKVKVMKEQLKEAKEITNKSKKEISKLQKEYNLLTKYAKQWGKMIEVQGKFNSYQQKFYSKLCNGESREGDDVDQDDIEANETDKQSKLLEQLLDEGDGSDSMISPPDILPSDTELLKCSRKSPGKILPSKQIKQTGIRAQRRDSQDNATTSMLPDKTPTRSPLTRKRTRTSSQNSITTTSDADTATESEKEHKKRSGPRTRSSRLKMTPLPELKGPEPIPTSDPMNVIAERALPKLIADVPSQSVISNIFQLDPTPVKPIAEQQYSNKKEHIMSLSSSDSESQQKLSTKSSGDVAIPVQSTSSFGFDSSSDSDMENIPVPNCKLGESSSIDTSYSTINRVPCSIFALEADLDMSSSESEAEVPNQKKTLDSKTEAVDTSHVEKMAAEKSEETPETELMAVPNVLREASPVALKRNIESVNASSDEVSPTEFEMPEPSEENEELNLTENHMEEMPSEQADGSLNLESGIDPKLPDDQYETGQMTVNEITKKVFSLEESSSPQPAEEESKSDDVNKLSSTKSPIEIQETKLTEEDQSDDLEVAINIGKRLACGERVVASSEKVENQFSAEVGKQKSLENRDQDSEATVIEDKTDKLSNNFSGEIENPKSMGDVSFSENSEKELGDEDVIVPLGNLQEDQAANGESSITNQSNQDFQAMVSEIPEKEFPTKLREDQLAIAESSAEFSTESLSVETGLVDSEEDNQAFEVVTISDKRQEKLFVSEINDPLETPDVEECSLQVETEVLKPTEDIQNSQQAVSDQFETGMSEPIENNQEFQAMDSDESEKESPIKLQEDQLAIADDSAEFSTPNFSVESGLVESNENILPFGVVPVTDKCQEKLFVSEIGDNLETLQEDPRPNVVESLLQVETEILKPEENIKESQQVVSDHPEKELLHEVKNLLDKPEQGQRSIVDSNVELLNQTLVVDTDGLKKNIQDFEAAEVDDKCDEEPLEDNQKSQPAVSNQPEKELPREVEELLDTTKESQQSIFDVESRNQTSVVDTVEPKKNIQNEVAEVDDKCDEEPLEDSQKSQPAVSNQPEKELPHEVEELLDKTEESQRFSIVESLNQTLVADSDGPKKNIQDSKAVEVDDKCNEELLKENEKSHPAVCNPPEKELRHEVEDLLDKPEQVQQSMFDVESFNQTLAVDSGEPKKNIQDSGAAVVDDKCDEEPLEDNQKSQPAVSNQREKELPHEVEELLDKTEENQRFSNVESLNQTLVADSGEPKKNIQDFDAAEIDDKCDEEPLENNKKSQPAVNDHPEELPYEVEDLLDKTDEGQRLLVENAESLDQALMADSDGPKKNIQDSGAAVVDKELFNSKKFDPVEKLQEVPQTNVAVLPGKFSPSEVETEVLKSTNEKELEVLQSSNNKLAFEIEKQGSREIESGSVVKIIGSRKEMGTHLDKQGVHSIPVTESFSEKSTSTEVNVEPGMVSVFEAVPELPTIPTVEEAVSRASPQIIKQAISSQVLESSSPIPSKEKGEIDSCHQLGDKPLTPAQPTLSLTDNISVDRDAYPSLFDPPALPRQNFNERNNSSMIDPSKSPKVSRNLETPSAFKVPRIPSTPPRVPDVNLHSNFPWSKSISHGVKRTAVDDEVAVILKQIRTNIIELPTTVSPLPKSPEPQPIVPKKIEEPKSRFPILPRCAFNWTGKKLPMSDKLTERFGGYLHPGVHVRVRFRKVGRRLRDMRSPDILSHCFQGVTNFVEAERPPKPMLTPAPFIEDVTDEVESDKTLPEPSGTQSRQLSERRPLLPNSLFSTQSVTNIVQQHVQQKNSRSSIAAKGTTPVSRSKAPIPDLFGSDSSSSESECESDTAPATPNQECSSRSSAFTIPSPIQECPKRPSTTRNLKEKQPEPGSGSKQSSQLSNSSRTQALAQLVEPIIPLGRGSRNDSFIAARKNELRRDLESPTTNQTRYGFGLGRGVRTTQPTISPFSESLLSAVSKAKTPIGRVVAPVKQSFKQPVQQVPNAPVVKTPYLPDSSSPLNEVTYKKRVSHTLKRSLEPDSADSSVLPASKRGRTLPEVTPPAPSPPTPVPDKVESQEIPISARTRQKEKTLGSIKLKEMVKLDVKKTPSRKEKLKQKTTEKSPNNASKRFKRLAVENSTSESENEMEVNTDETGQSSSSEKEERSLNSDKSDSCGSSNEEERIPVQLPNSPQSPHVEESTEPPEMDESSKLSDVEESPKSPYVEESPMSPDNDESPKSPDENPLDEHESLNAKTVVEIPISGPTQSEQHQPSAFELVYSDLQKTPFVRPKGKQAKGNSKLKKEINLVVLKFFKDPEVVDEFLCRLIERVLRPDSMNNLSLFIRSLITRVIHGWNDLIDVTNTPPAPPMAVVHQRCVIVLQKLDEANAKLQVEPSVNHNMISDLFLSESSATMFKTEQTLTLEEMCSLSRAYTAVCRSRGCLAKARAFLFDCVYFMPPRSYALTYTIMTVWADVLRQVSFPLGTSCVDQTIAYCLLHNCKVKAVQGISGKVIQARSFLQNTYEYKNTTRTVDDLVDYLMNRFYETNSRDEASSLSWSLALLARWEGVDFVIQLIEKKLWPFLNRWSSGEGTNNAAAAVIITIGMLGKTVPASRRDGVKSVLDAMKTLLQSEGVVPPVQEAAIEAVIHLGETDDPKSIMEIVKSWKIENTYLSQHMRLVLKAFLKRHSDLCVV